MEFDSMSEDDVIGTFSVHLPDHLDLAAVEALSGTPCYEIHGHKAAKCGSMLEFSLSWSDFTDQSRLFGSWILTIKHATNLPSMDPRSLTSDPYCTVIARNDTSGKEMRTMTCVKVRCLNPVWEEMFSLPIVRKKYTEAWTTALAGSRI
jgi:hypothetical protein